MIKVVIYILLALWCAFLGGLFSGSETGMYQLSRLRLRMGVQKKKWAYVLLSRTIHDSQGMLLSMLIGNNFANYFATSFATYLFFMRFHNEYQAELLATVAATPVLFIISELIPKNLFYYRADMLMPKVSPVLYGFDRLFRYCGAVAVLKMLATRFSQLVKTTGPPRTAVTAAQKHHIEAILKDTREEDFLSPVQMNIIYRLVRFSQLQIRSVMTGINRTRKISRQSTRDDLLEQLRLHPFTRVLVYGESPDDIVGFVNLYECLGRDLSCEGIKPAIRPIRSFHADLTVIQAINIMQRDNLKILLVIRKAAAGQVQPVGILTMKDLVEELLGELSEW